MTDRVDAEPKGFRLLMPPGWRSFSADDAGRRSFIEALASRTRALGRPDLDVQLRMLVSQQWRALEQQRAFAVYLPVGETEHLVPPAAIAVRKLAVADGVEFAAGLGERFGISPERHATAIGQILRWRSSGAGREPLAEVRSVQVGYAFPAPVPQARVGLVFLATIPVPEGADPELVEGMVELVDTIMETFRWQ